MPTWSRTIVPQRSTWPQYPTGLIAPAHSGKVQVRSTMEIGRRWTETYGPLKRSTASTAAFLAMVNDYWRNQTIFQIDHRGQRGIHGTGTGTPLVNGASQTGSSIITDGWTASSTVLRAGDIILIGALTTVFDVTADATTNGSGQVTISINPPIFSGGSPADNAAITRNNVAGNVTYRARLADVQMPESGPNEFYIGCVLTFAEVPS